MLLIAASTPPPIREGEIVFLAEFGERTPFAVCHSGGCDLLIDPPTFNIAATEKAQELTEASFS